MEIRDARETDIDESDTQKKKRNTCLIICIIFIIVLMLPSTLAFLAIF
jgi:flagellar basal body-associated protein FliL